MAITVPDLTAAPTVWEVRLAMVDVNGERTQVNFMVDGAAAAADIQTALRAYEALTNAAFDDVSIVGRWLATAARSAAVAALEQKVSDFAALTFTRTNPVNTEKTMFKSIAIPAYVNALKNSATLLPDTGNANLIALYDFLQDNLAFEAADGDIYSGSFTYANSRSGFGTKPSRIDGA